MVQPPYTFSAAVVIGRFQPFHNGHLALLQRALTLAPRVVVVLGSAHSARTPRNPWNHEERARMIADALPPAVQRRVTYVPLRDYYDEPRWRKTLVHAVQTQLQQAVDRCGSVDSNGGADANSEDAGVVVVGHFKDATSDYLRGFAGWHLDSVPLQGDVHATPLRDRYLLATTAEEELVFAALAHDVPPNVVATLRAFRNTEAHARLAAELQSLNASKSAWETAPYPPVFVTVDAVVTSNAHVLLVQRGKAPGKDLWALPGGFLELTETTLQSALRELREETGLRLTEANAQPRAQAVFDHPQRSLRGRTISHAFHFELALGSQLPPVHAADDAQACRWVAVNELRALESELFDDHFMILDHFLSLLPRH